MPTRLFLWMLFLTLATAAIPVHADSAPYLLQSGDRIRMTVFGEDEMNGELEIAPDGTVAVPLLGTHPAAGKSLAALEREITAALNEDYLVEPRVSLQMTSLPPIFVLGQVRSPGSYAYRAGLDARKAVALAGGFTSRAQTAQVTVRRSQNGEAVTLEITPDDTVLPGDTLEVERRWF